MSPKVSAFADELAETAVKASGDLITASPRKKLEQVYLKNTLEIGGMPSWQGKRVLHDLLDASQGKCGGASCEKVFGLKAEEVDDFVNNTHNNLLQDKDLAKAENSAVKKTLVASTQPSADPWVEGMQDKPLQVVFRKAKEAYERGVTEIGVARGPLGASIEITPEDLKKAKSILCNESTCEIALDRPVNFNAQLPGSMQPSVSLTYQRTTDETGMVISQQGKVGVQATPIKLGDLLEAKIKFAADLEKGPATGDQLAIKNVECKGTLACKLPMVKFEAIFDKNGIEFDSVADQTMGGVLLKASPRTGVKLGRIEYAQIPQAVASMRDNIAKATSGAGFITHPDVDWNDFALGSME